MMGMELEIGNLELGFIAVRNKILDSCQNL